MTTPSAVYIANWERLVTKRWLPSYISGRSFRKYGSADPGLLYVWSEQKVPNKETFTVTNCIGFYDYRNAAETLTPYSAYTQPASEASVQSVAAPVTKPTVTTIYRTAPASRPAAVEKKQSGEVAEPAASVEPVPEVQPDGRSTPAQPVKNEAPERDYRYVQALLDKIAELEQSSDELSMEEIQKLRTEVDNAIEAIQEQ